MQNALWPPKDVTPIDEDNTVSFKTASRRSFERDGFHSAMARQEALEAYAKELRVRTIPSLETYDFDVAVAMVAAQGEGHYVSPSCYLSHYLEVAPQAFFHGGRRIGPLKNALVATLFSEGQTIGIKTTALFAGIYQNLTFFFVPEQEYMMGGPDVNEKLFAKLAVHPQRQPAFEEPARLVLYAREDRSPAARAFLEDIREGYELSDFAGDPGFGEPLGRVQPEPVGSGDIWLLPPAMKRLPVGGSEPARILTK